MASIIPFPNQIRDVMNKIKCNLRKLTHSTQFPNQTCNVDKNEKDKKAFCQMQTKMSFNQQTI